MTIPIVELLTHTPDPERLVAVAAKRCYSKHPANKLWHELSNSQICRLLEKVIRQKHLSVLEHANFTFVIEGVSRVLSHQLVRHRIGSYTQQSQQRANEEGSSFVIPPEISDDYALRIHYEQLLEDLQNLYERILDKGISKGHARYIIPNACTTRIIMTMNARSLFNLIAQRTCSVEEWEFRTVATKIHEALMTVAPNIFKFAGPSCITDLVCYEGERGAKCGRYKEIPGAILKGGPTTKVGIELCEKELVGNRL